MFADAANLRTSAVTPLSPFYPIARLLLQIGIQERERSRPRIARRSRVRIAICAVETVVGTVIGMKFVRRAQIEQALGPVVLDVMREHGANLMVDSGAIVATASGTFNVTKTVIQQLDRKLPSVKVELIDPPSSP